MPLLIHILLLAGWPADGCCCGGAGLPNISANGLPNCSKSSEAFDCVFCAPAVESVPPNRSTIFVDCVGDDKNGFVAAAVAPLPPVGDVSLVC